jgi:hypothetical protein
MKGKLERWNPLQYWSVEICDNKLGANASEQGNNKRKNRPDLLSGNQQRIGLGELSPRTNYSQDLMKCKQSMGRGAGRNNNPFFIIPTPVPSH